MFRSLLLPPKSGFNKVKRLVETPDRQKCSAQKERALRNRPDSCCKLHLGLHLILVGGPANALRVEVPSPTSLKNRRRRRV
jgi:hypothetical protein